MNVEKANLRDGLRADVIVAFVLRARFQATTARHATRISVALHHVFLIHARSGTEIVSSVQLDPSMHALEMSKHLRAIDFQVTNVWKLGHGLELDRLIQIIDQR